MSSYWAGYSGTGLVLNQSEFNSMLKAYKDKNPEQAANIDEVMENGSIYDFDFIRSIYAGEPISDLEDSEGKCTGKLTDVCELSDDNVDGVTFWPFYRPDGRMNVNYEKEDGSWDTAIYSHPIWASKDEACYVFWSDKDMSSPRAFEQKPYESYDAFVKEFKDKLAAYLPEDFDWNAHLGYLSYACYA